MLRLQLTIGVILMVVTLASIAWIGVNEEERLRLTAAAQHAASVQEGAELYVRNCAPCHGEHAQGIPGLCPPLNSVVLLQQRAEETGWTGSLHDFVKHTIEGGRLVSTRPDEYVGQKPSGAMAMPFWAQEYGGPLRPDQVEDITLFLLNFTDQGEALLEDEEPPVAPEELEADPVAAGRTLYVSLGCGSCHELADVEAAGEVGPTHENLATTALDRLEEPEYTGEAETAAEYVAESIVNPGAYVVPGYANVMPAFTQLSDLEVTALVQYMLTVTAE